jgi:hypothetical protein
VWVPRVAVTAGWAPYHDGHWAWVAPWGWTWIDDAPWGFAPFHYGRWAYIHSTWAWVPGPLVVAQPPVYAPALVAFVGGGGGAGGIGWGINLSIGGVIGAGVAWIPLGPGEPWRPAYRTSAAYYNHINYTSYNHTVNNYNSSTRITNITNITYVNRAAPGGISAVPANAFVQGRGVAQAGQSLRPEQIAHAQIGAGSPAIAPVKASVAPGQRIANTRPPQALASRQVVATRAPVTPPAMHDALAARYAQTGGQVAGAGAPVVRNGAPNATGLAGNRGITGFHVVPAVRHPAAAQEANRPANSNGVPHPTAPAAQAQNRTAIEAPHGQQREAETAAGHPAQARTEGAGTAPEHAGTAPATRPQAVPHAAAPSRPPAPQHAQPVPHAQAAQLAAPAQNAQHAQPQHAPAEHRAAPAQHGEGKSDRKE